ncbi:energy-coupling factor ABC transporter permease [Streptomyces sp. DSM 42041]|uniref:Energy-coupling factor ABC transporter permease n=1 Tax=Streptomyces hazeniae TaxID=3075538 RepID=A0ABU2NR76_9ACTN|nr:energy-coupling factor ABC transporter permease [Streptomyces sp. DSM 42041]MDT0379475.1 energy-coupling factor ABC transporter permease [Streptomyces sp. DSM 42041]
MHVPDGFINAPVSVATGVVAVGAVAVSLRGARRELGERTAPLAGLVAAFIFAVQMLNFPVGAGTSGHLLGGALAAILVGPYTGVLCISVVLLMQAVLFADGGLTALGTNITTMGVVGVVVAYGVFRGLVKVLPRRRSSLTASAFVAAVVSVPVAAASFVGVYALGGTADVALGKVLGAMVGVHVLIGIGEAIITALTVGAVLSVRPDLVYGARGLTAPLTLRTGAAPAVPGTPAAAEQSLAARTETTAPAPQPGPAAHRPAGKVWLAGLGATLACAGVISFYASAHPDGLEKVAAEFGFEEQATEHDLAESPLADYGVADVENARISGGLAGVVGVGATLAVGSGVFLTVRRRRSGSADAADTTPADTTSATGADPDGGSLAAGPSPSRENR